MPASSSIELAYRAISHLAYADRPGAIVLAEHVVDQHVTLFAEPTDQLTALDALARDLIRLGRQRPELGPFLRRVDDYIGIIQRPMVSPLRQS